MSLGRSQQAAKGDSSHHALRPNSASTCLEVSTLLVDSWRCKRTVFGHMGMVLAAKGEVVAISFDVVKLSTNRQVGVDAVSKLLRARVVSEQHTVASIHLLLLM